MHSRLSSKIPTASMHSAEATLQIVARNTSWTITAAVLTGVVALITGILLPRAIGARAMGEYSCAVWIASWIGMLCQAGVTQAVLRYVAELGARSLYAEAKTLALTVCKFQALLALSATALILSMLKSTGASTAYLMAVAVACFSSSILSVAGTLVSAVNGIERFDRTSRASMPITCAGGALLLFALAEGANYLQVLILGALASVAWAIAQTRIFLTTFSMPRLKTFPAELASPQSIFFYSITFLVCTIFTTLILDKGELPLIKYFCGDETVGMYAVAVNISQKIAVIPYTIAMVLVPTLTVRLSSGRKELASAIFQWTVRAYGLILTPVAIILACLSQSLIELLYGKGFEPAVLPLQICCLSSIPLCATMPALTCIYSAKWLEAGLLIRLLVPLFMDFIASITLIPLYGATGAAIAAAAGQLLLACVLINHIKKHGDVQVPAKFLCKLGGCSLFTLLSCYLLMHHWKDSRLSCNVITVFAGTGIFFASITLAKCLTGAEVKGLCDAIRKLIANSKRAFSPQHASTSGTERLV